MSFADRIKGLNANLNESSPKDIIKSILSKENNGIHKGISISNVSIYENANRNIFVNISLSSPIIGNKLTYVNNNWEREIGHSKMITMSWISFIAGVKSSNTEVGIILNECDKMIREYQKLEDDGHYGQDELAGGTTPLPAILTPNITTPSNIISSSYTIYKIFNILSSTIIHRKTPTNTMYQLYDRHYLYGC